MQITELARVKRISGNQLQIRKLLSNGVTVEQLGRFGCTYICSNLYSAEPSVWIDIRVRAGFEEVELSNK